MSTKTWNVGIIGCGAISRNHIEAVQAIDGAEVTAVCDVDAAKAQEIAEKYGIASSFSSVDEILASGVDIVAVCTPHPTHEAVVLAAAAAGVHVLCEKPIAIELESAQRMIDACESAGVQLGVLFQRRFWPAAQKMKKELVDGSLGRPIMGQCTVALYRKHSYYTATPWRGTWEADGGGVLMTQAIHYIDLMCWLLGEPVEVFGYTDSFKHGDNIEVEDSAVATVRFESGALATISATTAAEPALGAQVQVMGTEGATMTILEFPEGTEGRLTVRGENDTVETTPSHPSDLNPNADLSTINGALIPYHTAQIADFIDALNDNREPLITGRDATKALKVLLGVYESAATHLPVSLI